MNPKEKKMMSDAGIPLHPELIASVASVASGAAAGAAVGLFSAAGLPGVIVGTILGAAGGAGIAAYVRLRAKRTRAGAHP